LQLFNETVKALYIIARVVAIIAAERCSMRINVKRTFKCLNLIILRTDLFGAERQKVSFVAQFYYYIVDLVVEYL
jgi:hypothetical protein